MKFNTKPYIYVYLYQSEPKATSHKINHSFKRGRQEAYEYFV